MLTHSFRDQSLAQLADLAASLGACMEDDDGGDLQVTPAPVSPLKAAGEQYLATLTEEQKNAPLAGPEEEAEVEAEPRESAKKEKKEKPKEPARAEDGKFAKSKKEKVDTGEGAESEDEIEAERLEEEGDESETEEGEDEDAKVVVIKGLDERGEEDLELEVQDPEVAERIRRLQNDGLRRKEYNERVEALESRDMELQEIEATMEANPIGFVLDLMTPERQLDVARALIAEHFEDLKPDLEKFYDDPAEIPKAQLAARKEKDKNTAEATKQIMARKQARSIETAVRALIPEEVDRRTAERFMRDAERDLLDAHGSGERLSPSTVGALLKDRIRMYGFVKAKEQDPAGARPVTDRAKELAERTSRAKQEQSRVKRTQVARKNASAIAPAGVGAGVVREPLVKPGSTVEEASAQLRKKGLSGSWTDFSKSRVGT